MINLSIIIPYHNESFEKTHKLLFMLDSQVNCTYETVEIIISNNCEEPKNENLRLDTYKNLEGHIKLVYPDRKNNIGLSRQCGVDNATGKYIMYIDSDDILYSVETISQILSIIENCNSQVIYLCPLIELPCRIEGNDKIFQYALHCNKVNGFHRNIYAHDKLYNRQFLIDNNIRFINEIAYNEDGYYNTIIDYCATDISDSNIVTYVIKMNQTSVSRTQDSVFQRFVGEQSILAFYYAMKFGVAHGKSVIEDVYRSVYNSYYIINLNYRLQKNRELYYESIKYTEAISAKVLLEYDKYLISAEHNIKTHIIYADIGEERFIDFLHRIITEFSEETYNEAIERNKKMVEDLK